ncbi:MAG: hypothetical protein WDO16_25095 [Bacteroidota bacterium]
MMAQYEQLMKNYKSGTITAPQNMSIMELGKYGSVQTANRVITDLVHVADPGRYIFKPVVHNKDKLIIQDKLNGKVIFPENTATEYAWFHLTLEHDPDGPYKLAL